MRPADHSADPLPSGFRANAVGLLVPEDISREREVWTKADYRILERATKLLQTRGIQIFLRCNNPDCQKLPMTRRRMPDGGLAITCGHKDRIVVNGL